MRPSRPGQPERRWGRLQRWLGDEGVADLFCAISSSSGFAAGVKRLREVAPLLRDARSAGVSLLRTAPTGGFRGGCGTWEARPGGPLARCQLVIPGEKEWSPGSRGRTCRLTQGPQHPVLWGPLERCRPMQVPRRALCSETEVLLVGLW